MNQYSYICKIHFLLGLVIGIMTAFLTIMLFLHPRYQHTKFSAFKTHDSFFELGTMAKISGRLSDFVKYDNSNRTSGQTATNIDDRHMHQDNEITAKDLERRIRVLCWVMTSPRNLEKKALHVKNTWGKRCNILLFMSSVSNLTFPAIGLNVSEGRKHLTEKTILAFKYVYEHYRDKADWFMKADDDTYVILENLRYFLKDYNTSDPVYFGKHFTYPTKQEYMSGGAGYVLSKEALTRYVMKGNDSTVCKQHGPNEDVTMGECMGKVGVKIGNSTDALGRSRFHCFIPEYHLKGNYPKWYYSFSVNDPQKGTESVSDYAITFHYISPEQMHVMDFFIYHLRPYGIYSGEQQLNKNK
ncbi:glycoprotein-N-acetylgalactosamine 3-beta-galactosyltransferase 1-like [Mytilus edulis]|uniref:glycoprotein-N-acetylgalactosamine 3-beta-galactosyltransferase 1-like n=1 Tax=Mytilus edulis TaxID=6550 RepID=UPI0039EE2C56